MKKIATIFLLVLCISANSQLDWEGYYSKKDFHTILQQAKSPKERIYALGLLATKTSAVDSIIREIYSIAEKTGDLNLKASSFWWDAKRHSDDTVKVMKLLQFAEQNNLSNFRIAANLLMADYHIHHLLDQALYYASNANSLIERWNSSKLEKDSVKIDVYRRLAHIYVHKTDWVNVARYLLQLRNYAELYDNERIRMQAVEVLSDMYAESMDKKAISWSILLREYFRKTDQLNKYLGMTWGLGTLYSGLYIQDSIADYKVQAGHYFKEMDSLVDSLQLYDNFLFWALRRKFEIGFVTGEQAIELVDNNYNAHLDFSPLNVIDFKLQIYMATNQLDSANIYISKLMPLDSGNARAYLKDYYFKKKDYKSALPILKRWQENSERKHYVQNLQWIYADLATAYEGTTDFRLAYEYKLKSLRIKDSLDKVNGKEEIASMELQKQVELQQAAFKDEQTRIEFRNKVRLFVLLGGIAVLILLASVLWRNNQRKQKDKIKIENAYNELKSTQQQLIQSEKMASLGELTAGIAHEIQNPLNFVNNFSDVNAELIDELTQEADKGNVDEVKSIAKDIKDNEQKINHHGKRADAIVKGMLQHSRAGSGQKELTDINALADEYLRLAYHGLRAKDKSFNATTTTEFDNSVGKVNIVPQEIGRVILNLINNAFYAVNEKAKQNIPGYEPIVIVNTKTVKPPSGGLGVKIEIKVKDNGNGIPQKVLDKVFQPFFTTKPTGQGTGLGLSLAYDIITKGHGGELRVETKEGEGSEFIIQLPLS